jgi:hypothetical protein
MTTQRPYIYSPFHQQPSCLEHELLRWIVRYFIGTCVALLVFTFVCSGAGGAVVSFQAMAKLVLMLGPSSSIVCTFSPLRIKGLSVSALFLALIAFTLQRPFFARGYIGAYHAVWPDTKFLDFCDALRTSSTKPLLSVFDESRMFQVGGLDDGYMEELSSAMEVHFDRYARNETEQFPTIKSLNLLANHFGARGVASLSRALSHEKAYTKSLLIGRNRDLGDVAMKTLNGMLAQNNALETLTIDGHPNKIGQEGFHSLFSSFSKRAMGYVDLNYNKQIRHHLSLIGEASLLEEVILTGTGIKDSDIPTLVEAVLKTNIKKLDLTNTRVGPNGVEALLPLTRQLTELGLGICRRIGDSGAKLLASALKDPESTLENLSLFNSNIGQEGAQALLDAFPQNTRMKHLTVELDLHNPNRVPSSTLVALGNAVRANWKSG